MITTNEEPVFDSLGVVGRKTPLKRTVRITANIFTNPDSTFPVTVKPAIVVFPDTGETAITEYYFSISNISGQSLRPALISYPRSLVSVVLPKVIAAGQSADGSIKLSDIAQNEIFEKSVTIQFDDTTKTRITIPVRRGTVTPPPLKKQAGH